MNGRLFCCSLIFIAGSLMGEESPSDPSAHVASDQMEMPEEPAPETRESDVPPTTKYAILDLNCSYYYPFSKTLRHIYHEGGLNWNLSLSVLIYRYLYLWESFDYFSRSGSSLRGAQTTELTVMPFTLGLKCIYPIGAYRIHVAGGGKYYFISNRNTSDYVDAKINKKGLGGAVEFGISRLFARSFQMNVYCNYSFKKFQKRSTAKPNVFLEAADFSGLYAGLGLGYYF